MLRPAFLLLLLVPAFCLAQKVDKRVVKALQTDIAYLAPDQGQARTTGTGDERKAAQYLIARYEKLKIPAWGDAYRHPFKFVHGIEMNDSRIVLGGQSNLIGGEAFPLPFSGNGSISGDVLIEVQEMGAIWLLPLHNNAGEATDATFDWAQSAWKDAEQAAKDGATGVVFYDAYGAANLPRFDPFDKHEKLKIPVAFVGNKQWKELSANEANMVSVTLETKLSKPERNADNVIAFIDNKAAKTVIIGANYDAPGKDGQSAIHDGGSDNASGTAAVLQLAEWLKKNRLRNYNVILAHFSGQLGAAAFCKDMTSGAAPIAGMIDLYAIGQLADSPTRLQLSTAAGFPARKAIPEQLRKAGISEAPFAERTGGSEYATFERSGIPALAISGEIRSGEAPKTELNLNAEARVITALQAFLKQMDAAAGKH